MDRGLARHLVDISVSIAIVTLILGGAAHRLVHANPACDRIHALDTGIATTTPGHSGHASDKGDLPPVSPAQDRPTPRDHQPSKHQCPYCLMQSAGAIVSAPSPGDVMRFEVCERLPALRSRPVPMIDVRLLAAPRAPPVC